MVTISLVVFYCFSVFIISFIDTFFYDISLYEAIFYNIYPESATREIIVVLALLAGLICSMIIDYRHHKNKQTVSK
jgi:hypothetical protein